MDALKRFQHDQNLPEDGKVGSLSLIALGLGPKRGNGAASDPAPKLPAPVAPPAEAPPAEPAQSQPSPAQSTPTEPPQ